MKLFYRDHVPFIVLYISNMFLLFLFYAELGGFATFANLSYFLFLSGFLLVVFLCYRYLRHRKLYQKLSQTPTNLADSITPTGSAPLAQATDAFLRAQYDRYQEQLHWYQRKQTEHLTFIHQWVHQMKTPLSVIHLMLQEQEGEPFAEKIGQEVERISRGLNMALYMARLGSFQQDFHVESVKLNKLVTEVINAHKRYFIRKKLYPEVQVDPQMTVRSDQKWLKFVLEQLVVNAIKYTDAANKKIMVTAYKHSEGKVLEVTDQGVGIPKEDRRRVFEPFYTGKNGRRFGESTGMGLYLVQQVCQKLQHRLQLVTREGKGTTIRVIFSI